MQLSSLSLALTANDPQGLTRSAVSVLQKYGSNAHIYLPGLGVIDGITAANYLDDAGTTPATVDNPVGLALDAVQGAVLGAECILNGDFSAGATGWMTQAGWAITTGVATGSAVTGSLYQTSIITVGVFYEITFTIATLTAGNITPYIGLGAPGPVITTPGTYTYQAIAATNGNVNLLGTGFSGTVTNISVKQVPGTHATQATTANKPILRRGLVNLLTYSNDLTNAAWTMTAATGAANLLKPDTSNSRHRVNHVNTTVTNGAAYTTAVRAAPGGYRYLFLDGAATPNVGQACFDLQTGTIAAVANGTATMQAVGDGSYICAVSATAAATAHALYLQVNNTGVAADTIYTGDGTSGIYCYATGLFAGTVSASQILSAGGIPPTTSAAASSTLGNCAWEFNGSTNQLTMAAAPFQVADDFYMGVGAKATSVAGTPGLLSVDDGGVSNVLTLYLASATPTIFMQAGGTFAAPAALSTVSAGAAFVASALQVSRSCKVSLNGVAGTPVSTSAVGSNAYSQARLGYQAAGPGFLNGTESAAILVKGTVSTADALTLDRFLGSLSGVYF